ncbi:hypothetical protein Pan161_23930 [Gimesia algae]|uniref:Uncharacterized protein n=2 Tax=Gimesia algae TaxID=2527971 RepID=A0A517VCN0_9PLAN|nr:hypothetical protein Pan161_23930 [Gimesia algae]
MGISHSKAGEVVDCPTCGLSVRVPGLDGEIAPIPKPQLDLKDAELANALDELAAIGANVTLDKQKISEQIHESLSSAAPPQNSERTSIPEEAFKAIPVKSLHTSEPPQQLEPAHVSDAPERQAVPISQLQTEPANQTEVNHAEELSTLAGLAQKRAADMLAEKKKNKLKRAARFELQTLTWVIILITFGALTFSIGLLLGRNVL